MSRTTPTTPAEIKAEFADRSNYFAFMCAVAQSKDTPVQKAWCSYARKVMVTIGYPAVTASWTDEQTINYAQNIVAMG
jgi:hypothetical protein